MIRFASILVAASDAIVVPGFADAIGWVAGGSILLPGFVFCRFPSSCPSICLLLHRPTLKDNVDENGARQNETQFCHVVGLRTS